MKKHFTTIILVIIMLAGLSLLLYPTVSNYVNSLHQSKAVSSYVQQINEISEEEYEQIWKNAREYNRKLSQQGTVFNLSDEQREEYNQQLKVEGTEVMGYVEIPSIQCMLAVYHGTDEAVLQAALGHLEWSSLPIGGEGTHCVISGHRGLPSAKLFTNLDKLAEGDYFTLTVMDKTITYEVDQILIVLPEETSALRIEDGKDYCTLMTCTPYGVNTHRLLVRGVRTDNVDDASGKITSDAMQIEPVIVASVIAIPALLLILIFVIWDIRRKSRSFRNRRI